MLCVWPNSLITEKYGRVVAHASLSARLAEALGLLTSGTYGPTGSGLSSSVDLTSCLASKLQARTVSAGSILYRLTWKTRVTPSGRQIPALRASQWSGKTAKAGNGWNGPFVIAAIPALRPTYAILPIGLAQAISEKAENIFANDCILSGWPTPTANASTGAGTEGREGGPNIQTAGALSGWPTPCQQDGPNGGPSQGTDRLPGCAPLVGWPTASCSNDRASRPVVMTRDDGTKNQQRLQDFAAVVGWTTTTTTRDHKDSPGMVAQRDGKDRADQLPRQAYLTGWGTPMANDKVRSEEFSKGRSPNLLEGARLCGPMRLTSDGNLLTGCSAGMPSGGQLDPAHSRFVMGLPPEWDDFAPMAMVSTRGRRGNSAKSSKK